MARWASLVEERRGERPVLLIDAGDFYPSRETRFQDVADRYFFKAMRLFLYDAVGVGEHETRLGLEKVRAIAKGYDIPFVSSNIIDRSRKKPAAPPWIIKDIGGTKTLFGRKGGVRVGIFSVALSTYIYGFGMDIPIKYYVIDPKLSAREAVTKLRSQGCDLVIAVSHQNWSQSLILAREVPDIDIVLSGHGAHNRTYEEHIGSTAVVEAGDREYSFTEVAVTFTGDSLAIASRDVCGTLLNSPGDPRFIELQKEYESEMRKLTRASLVSKAEDPSKK